MHNMRLPGPAALLAGVLLTALLLFGCASFAGPEAEPGTIEMRQHPDMDKVLNAADQVEVADDEFAVFYYRPDEDYEDWAMWVWALGSGDGSDTFDNTQDWKNIDGVGVMIMRQDGADIGAPIVGEGGETGFIIRLHNDWVKETPEDRVWDYAAGNKVAVFHGDPVNYSVGEYVPFIQEAMFTDVQTIEARLSGRHALQTSPDSNGFYLESEDGDIFEVADVVNTTAPDRRNSNFTDRITLKLAEPVTVGSRLRLVHPEYQAPYRVTTAILIPQIADQTVPPMDYDLGALYDADTQSVEFRLWSPLADWVRVRIYSESQQAEPDWVLDMELNQEYGVWSVEFDEQDPDGFFYDYELHQGGRDRVALDPYAFSMDAFLDDGSAGRGAIIDMNKAAPIDGWQGYTDYHLDDRINSIVYEVHVRDFTISDDANVENEPGTYLAFTEKLGYIQDLGITHIELMPVMNFYFNNELEKEFDDSGTSSNNNYNWGYDPHSWFSPEGFYATDPTDPYSRVNELMTLIRDTHQHDMGILLDVIYNHYGNTNLLEDIVEHYYFRKTPAGAFTSNSGVGNDYASTRYMARKLIVDSIYHWVKWYHIDGMRFDLAGLIDTETIEMARERVAALPDKEDIFFQGEGWEMYNGPEGTRGMEQSYMTETDEFAVFNDEIRDLMKGGGFQETAQRFLTTGPIDTEQLFYNLIGQPQVNYTATEPGDSLAYIEKHDGLTLHDNIAYNADIDHTTAEGRQEIAQRVKVGNLLLITGQSIPFIHAGQERLRTKPRLNAQYEFIGPFIRNSYDSSDDINQFIWEMDEVAQDVYDYTRALIHLRRDTQAFRIGSFDDISATYFDTDDGLSLAYSIEWEGDTWYILANTNTESFSFELDRDLNGSVLVADQSQVAADGIADPVGVQVSGSTVTLDGLTAALIRY
ncbi:pullulanase-associated domain-containing protein [Spirochaeta africana]|uniref:pullulanase n=1 Tax=Spirochaeta africana (strain ATCC 700263 / DSM 8902 / Z-7692) TaxID=889378 RepID=H9ULI7_SPIAZ|nr:alpha-amylase family glycosyl hydrolase [Spirochaeta africana]AFG38380.1 pullulanase-like glycosidase possibly secreted by type II secretory pathway [Spirochaeta africana DSM 8902]